MIEAALAETGFAEDEPEKKIMVGFARQTVLGVADQVLAAVKEGKIRHIFLVEAVMEPGSVATTIRNWWRAFPMIV